MAVDVRVDVEELGAQLDVGDVLEPQDLAVGIGPQNDVRILLRLVVAPDVGQDVLFRLRRLARGLAESAGRTDDALLRQGLHDVFGGHVVGAHAVGVQPDPHREGAVAEVPGDAHALDPLEHGHDVDVGEVEKVFLVGVRVRAVDVHVHQHARHDLADEDALAHHQGREPAQHDVDPVLHVHDVDVRVRARLEVDRDRRLAGTGGGGDHVTHVLDAVDGLLQRNQDRVDQDVGTGAGIGDGDLHGRRRDVGELGDRQGLDPQHPQEQEDDRDDDRQRRPMENFCEHGSEMISLDSVSGSVGKRLLFRVVFLVCKNLFRLAELVFHLLAVVNLSDPLENDLVVHIESALDDEDVLQFVLDGDLALMHHVILVDDVNVPLVEDLERRPLRDDDGVLQRSVDQHGAGLTVTQQAVRVREIRAEGDVPGLVVEFGLDRADLAGLRGTCCRSPA